ncbi:MAG: hypothetical protein WAK93_03770 [Solirubrobacteraceae bacterium]
MRRIAVVCTAAVVLLAVAAGAYAASSTTNPYNGSFSFGTKKAGTAKKPVPLSYKLTVLGSNGAGQARPPKEFDVKTSIYGQKLDGKDFPTCSLAKIAAAKNDNVCPKGAMVAQGSLNAVLGADNDFTKAGDACNPILDVWNSGQGKETFFFVTNNTNHTCLGVATGGTPPYPGTYKTVGKYTVSNVPVPSDISEPLPGLAGSTPYEHLNFSSHSKKVKGKKVYSSASVACTKGKRPWTVTVTSQYPGQPVQTSKSSGSSAC